MTRLCFGRLRAVEVEQLTERAWFAITETCLAMTIFREEIGPWFLVMFTALVSGKIWGWIGDGRVEVLEQQPPANPHLFHLRLSVSLAVSFLYDIWLLHYAIGTVIQQARPNMMVMFLFEFAVLSTCSWRTGIRYLFSVAEQRIIKTQTQNRLLERRREVREQREEMTRQRESAAASGQAPDPNEEPLPHEDDIDEMDIEVPGWSAKGEWVLWLDLITGKLYYVIALITLTSETNLDLRYDQTGHLHCILHDDPDVLWFAHTYHTRFVHDITRLLEETERTPPISPRDPGDEPLPRCHRRGAGPRKHMHYLP